MLAHVSNLIAVIKSFLFSLSHKTVNDNEKLISFEFGKIILVSSNLLELLIKVLASLFLRPIDFLHKPGFKVWVKDGKEKVHHKE